MRFPWSARPVEDEVVVDLRERLAPYTKDPDSEPTPGAGTSFMRERPLRATSSGVQPLRS